MCDLRIDTNTFGIGEDDATTMLEVIIEDADNVFPANSLTMVLSALLKKI